MVVMHVKLDMLNLEKLLCVSYWFWPFQTRWISLGEREILHWCPVSRCNEKLSGLRAFTKTSSRCSENESRCSEIITVAYRCSEKESRYGEKLFVSSAEFRCSEKPSVSGLQFRRKTFCFGLISCPIAALSFTSLLPYRSMNFQH